nr:hypothetical protein OG409_02875 [Streptomyces sp. NBC_00974]
MAWYQGHCLITVIGVDADWPQRTVVTVHGSRTRLVIPGTVGASQIVDAESWDLALEHQYNDEWRPNVRAVTSRWETVNGVESQVVRSKDHDWPGRTQERNLVLRIERIGAGRTLHHTLTDAVPKGTAGPLSSAVVGGALAPASGVRPASSSNGIPTSGAVPARPATTDGAGGGSAGAGSAGTASAGAAPADRGYPTTSSHPTFRPR